MAKFKQNFYCPVCRKWADSHKNGWCHFGLERGDWHRVFNVKDRRKTKVNAL